MIQRRSPGSRRRRTRREDELAQVERADPTKHAELLELRRYNPQEYRKELQRLVRRGVIARGRGFEVDGDSLALLGQPVKKIVSSLQQAIDGGSCGFRTIAGLLEAERAGSARSTLIGWLEQRYAELLSSENRSAV